MADPKPGRLEPEGEARVRGATWRLRHAINRGETDDQLRQRVRSLLLDDRQRRDDLARDALAEAEASYRALEAENQKAAEPIRLLLAPMRLEPEWVQKAAEEIVDLMQRHRRLHDQAVDEPESEAAKELAAIFDEHLATMTPEEADRRVEAFLLHADRVLVRHILQRHIPAESELEAEVQRLRQQNHEAASRFQKEISDLKRRLLPDSIEMQERKRVDGSACYADAGALSEGPQERKG